MVINRDASDTTGGFRFQKLRAATLIVESLLNNSACLFWCSLEQGADVNLETIEAKKKKVYEEEDKHYDVDSNFTLNSTQVLNTFVIFIDRYFEKHFSPDLRFGFYSTNKIGKEKKTKNSESIGIKFPDKISILSKLEKREFDDEIVEICSKLILEEYRVQYKGRKDGYLSEIESWSFDDWKKFLSIIDFQFKKPRGSKLEDELILNIKKLNFYSSQFHLGKEEIICGALLDKIEAKHLEEYYSARFLSNSDVELIFEKIKNGEHKPIDPAHSTWSEQQQIINDLRTLSAKIESVAIEDSSGIVKSFKQKAAMGSAFVSSNPMDKSVKATLYRLYDHVNDEFKKLGIDLTKLSNSQIEKIIEDVTNSSFEMMQELSKDFKYTAVNKVTIRDLVLHLFDSCFLAFDEVFNG